MSALPAPVFGAVLRQGRRAAEPTKDALAEKAGISVYASSALGCGPNRSPHQDTLGLLAAYYRKRTFAQPGVVQVLVERARLTLTKLGEVACPFSYLDTVIVLKAGCSARPIIEAKSEVREQQVYQVALPLLITYKRGDGSYRQKNTFRYFIRIS